MKYPWIRRAVIGFAVVLVVIVVAGVWFVATFDANRYKQVAIDWVQREYNRTLVIAGPIGLSLFPRIEVKLSEVFLSERDKPEVRFATLKEAALSARLWPLFSGQLVIDRVAARGAGVVLVRDKKGQSNFDDLIKPAEAKAQPKKPASSAAGFGFDVSRVQIEDFHAKVKDDLIPLAGDIWLEKLTSGRLAPGVESPISLAARLALAQPAVSGALSGETSLTFDPASGSAKLTAMKLGYKGDALGASAIDLLLRGALSYDAAQGMLQAAGLETEGSASFGAMKLAKSRLAIERFHYQPRRQSLALVKLRLDASAMRGADPLSFALEWPQLDVSGDKLKGSAATGRFALGGATSIEAKFESGPPAGSFQAIRLPGFTLAIKARSGPRQLDGTLKSDLLINPEGPRVNLEPLDMKAQVIEPSLKPVSLAMQGSVSAGTSGANWKLAGQLGANNFSSDGKVDLGKGPPVVQMQARFDSLDLNQVLQKPAPEKASADAGSAEAPIDLSGLSAVNGSFALAAGAFVWQKVRVADARIDASLSNGTLQLARLSGKAWGGSIDASGVAEAKSQRIGVKLNANDVDVNALLGDLASSDRLEGTGRVTTDLATRGKTIGDMRSNLSGTAGLSLSDGAIKGINLAQVFRQARALLRQDATLKSNQAERTDFSELNATFKVAGGVARNDDLEAKSPFLRLGGGGTIDVARERIDYTLRATVAETSKGQGGAELAALRGVTIPVVLSGPLDTVDWRIRWSDVAAGAIRGRVEDKLRERLGERLGAPAPGAGASAPARPEDRLKDKLRGLFK